MSGFVDDRVKTVLLVGRVLNGPQGAVGVVHAVRSLDHVAVPVLVRGLVVAGVRILYAVLVRVLGMGLFVGGPGGAEDTRKKLFLFPKRKTRGRFMRTRSYTHVVVDVFLVVVVVSALRIRHGGQADA